MDHKEALATIIDIARDALDDRPHRPQGFTRRFILDDRNYPEPPWMGRCMYCGQRAQVGDVIRTPWPEVQIGWHHEHHYRG